VHTQLPLLQTGVLLLHTRPVQAVLFAPQLVGSLILQEWLVGSQQPLLQPPVVAGPAPVHCTQMPDGPGLRQNGVEVNGVQSALLTQPEHEPFAQCAAETDKEQLRQAPPFVPH
jgi:hypothetical protein